MNKGGIEKFKKFWEKFWFIVWKDPSLKGWVISIIFLLFVIKLIFFPLLSLVTGTSIPLVIVESCSMYHEDNLLSNTNEWLERHEEKYFKFGITKNDFLEFPFKKGLDKGDILFVTGTKAKDVDVGDIIIFNVDSAYPIIHRVIEIKNAEEDNQLTFSTIGDNNNAQFNFEKTITENQLVGEPRANIAPYVGWAKLIFFETMKKFDRDPKTNFEGFCKEN